MVHNIIKWRKAWMSQLWHLESEDRARILRGRIRNYVTSVWFNSLHKFNVDEESSVWPEKTLKPSAGGRCSTKRWMHGCGHSWLLVFCSSLCKPCHGFHKLEGFKNEIRRLQHSLKLYYSLNQLWTKSSCFVSTCFFSRLYIQVQKRENSKTTHVATHVYLIWEYNQQPEYIQIWSKRCPLNWRLDDNFVECIKNAIFSRLGIQSAI